MSRSLRRVLLCILTVCLVGASFVAPTASEAGSSPTPTPDARVARAKRQPVPNPMPDPMKGICEVFRYGAKNADSRVARAKAAAMIPMCDQERATSSAFMGMVKSAYTGTNGLSWHPGDAAQMRTMTGDESSMTGQMKSHMKDLEVVVRSSAQASVKQLARAARAATAGRKFTEKRMSFPGAGFCKALNAAASAPQTAIKRATIKKLQKQQAKCAASKRAFAKAWKVVAKASKTKKSRAAEEAPALTARGFWDDIADAFSSFGNSLINVIADVWSFGGLLSADPGILVEPAYSQFIKARDKVLLGMNFFADAAAQAANDSVPLSVSWSGQHTIQYMKAGTSSYTGEPDPSHPKIPQNYLSATGGTPPYKFENVDPDSSVTVSPDGILAGWLTGYSYSTLNKSPGFTLGTNVRVTDANGQSKVVKVDQAYIFVKEFTTVRLNVGSYIEEKRDGCPFDCVDSRNPFPLLPPYVDSADSQWASSASATSSYHSKAGDTFSPSQATGVPTGTACVDYKKAWTSKKRDTLDTLTLKYDRAVVPSLVRIYEQYHPGAITKVTVSGSGRSAVIYESAAKTKQEKCPTSLRIPVSQGGQYPVDFPIDTVAVTVDQRVRDQRDQIDAVQLVGAS